ncbi:MAG: IPT/TIG domain-containing protein [Candidatus Sericytochromatia bacterium]|uniref:IPT/TIG domain-containing protein n=1 Tax=Candidatus Tanganyikabacteria bacterium TaxID=2961651 RepID=A0A937X871_9BACT|nr:IPT/TIG domain-containing protein [Candidatus Tanganyikabacteria bacterium]
MSFDCDPVHCITFDLSSGVFNFSSSSGPQVAFTVPSAGSPGTEVVINGARFETNPADNLVAFNGVAAQVIDGRADYLKVIVPVGASTGPLKVTKLSGASDSKLFQVNPMMNGRFTIYN